MRRTTDEIDVHIKYRKYLHILKWLHLCVYGVFDVEKITRMMLLSASFSLVVFHLITALQPVLEAAAFQEKCLVVNAICGTMEENQWHSNPIVVTSPTGKNLIQTFDVNQFCIDNGYNKVFEQMFCPPDASVPTCYTIFAKFSQTSPAVSKFWRIKWSMKDSEGTVYNAVHRSKLTFYWDSFSQSFAYSSARCKLEIFMKRVSD